MCSPFFAGMNVYIEGGEKTTEFYNDTNYSYLSQYIQVDRYDNVLSATFSLTGIYILKE